MPERKNHTKLETALSLLQDDDAEEIRKFSQSLSRLSSEEKEQKCERARDRLLKAQSNLHLVSAVYQIPFGTVPQSSQAWEDFNKAVSSSAADRSLKCVLAVSKKWGVDVAKHYAFFSKGRKYCDLLRTAANKVPNWKLAARLLNYWIFQRINGGGRTPPVKNDINPIEQSDLTNLQSTASNADDADFAKFYNSVSDGSTSNGFCLDKYGLLVREHFAAKTPNLIAPQTGPTSPWAALSNSHTSTSNCMATGQSAVPSSPSGELPSHDSFSDTSSLITSLPPSQSSSSCCQQDSQSSQLANTTPQSPWAISRPPTQELSEDYAVQRKLAVSSLSPSLHDSSKLIIPGNNDPVEYPITTPTDPRSTSQLSSQARDTARDRNVTPTPSGQGPPSPSSHITTTLEAMDFVTESLSSLRHTFAPGLTANETSPQLSSSLVEISKKQSISVPAISPTPLSSSSISRRLLPSSPLTKSRNSEPSLSPPGDFSHEAKSNMVEPPEVAYSEDDTAIKEELSQTATVAFSSPIEVTNNPTRSPSTDPNPALSPPSLSPRSSFHHEATQTLTATSNCRVNGAYLKDIGYRGEVHQRNVKIPQQSNNADCGVFHLAFAYQIVEDRRKFIDAVENGAGVDWTIDALKWRELVRLELTSANDNSAVINTAAEKIINVESDDDTCVEVVSVCHALTSSMDRDPATGHDVTAHARRDDFDIAKIACPTAHNSIIARTLSPSPPHLRPSLSSWPADTESSISLTLPPSQPTYKSAIGRFGQSVEMGDAGTDADRDANDEKMLDGSTLVARPLEAAFSSFHPSVIAVSTSSQSSRPEVIRL
ncbi:hypothetical protein ACKVV7_011464 [Pyricularia oryzae]